MFDDNPCALWTLGAGRPQSGKHVPDDRTDSGAFFRLRGQVMDIIQCPRCGRYYSGQMSICPFCQMIQKAEDSSVSPGHGRLKGIFLFILFWLGLFLLSVLAIYDMGQLIVFIPLIIFLVFGGILLWRATTTSRSSS